MTFEPMYLPVTCLPNNEQPQRALRTCIKSQLRSIGFQSLSMSNFMGGSMFAGILVILMRVTPKAVRGSSCSPFGSNHIHVYPEYRRSWQCPRLNASGNILCVIDGRESTEHSTHMPLMVSCFKAPDSLAIFMHVILIRIDGFQCACNV